MGVGLSSCFGQVSPQRLPKEDSDDHSSWSTSMVEFRKPSCLWTENEKEKRQLQVKGKQEQLLKKAEERTLEDWLLAEPGLHKRCINGGEYYVFKHFSNKIYPSLVGENAGSFCNNRDSFSTERQLKSDEFDRKEEVEVSSMSFSQSGKPKKKVSFRLPEEADIFIFYPHEEEFGE